MSQEVMHSRVIHPGLAAKASGLGVCSKGRATKWAPAIVSSVGGLPRYNCAFLERVPVRKKRKTQKPGPFHPA